MIVIILITLSYLVSICALYTIFTGHYNRYNKKVKHQLYVIMGLIVFGILPFVGFVIPLTYIGVSVEDGDYFESFLTKRY